MDRAAIEARAAHEAAQILAKKKPPKLKSVDRTMSLAIDNYTPGTSQQQAANIASGVAIDPNLLIDNNLTVPPPPMSHGTSSPIQEFRNPNIFYMESSNSSLNNYGDFPHSHAHHGVSRKPNIRRSDTLDVYGTGVYEMRKANSFNSNEATADEAALISRRTSSMRHSAFPYEMADEIGPLPPPAPPIITEPASNQRRNCRMHKSFHDRSRQYEVKKEKTIDAIKCHSLGDDGLGDDEINVVNKRRLSPKFNSAESSLDNEVFHSRSGSRNKIDIDTIEAIDAIEVSTTSPTTPSVAKKLTGTVPHKHSSHSLDKSHHSFRRIARATQSFYLNPNQFDELRLQRSMHGSTSASATGKRMHSASMRAKPFRETLSEAKKSKSFVTYPFAAPNEYELSPHRRDSKVYSGDGVADVKKSPRLSSNINNDSVRPSYDSRKSSNFDDNDLDYDIIMRAYRQNRRKSSIISGGIAEGSKKKGSAKKKSVDGNEMGIADGNDDEDDDGETESTRKRKRIVCIVVSVFLSLVFASVFVVVFTLTHSSMTQVSDHTKRVYTFAPGPGNRDMPIHHHNGKCFKIIFCFVFVFVLRFAF